MHTDESSEGVVATFAIQLVQAGLCAWLQIPSAVEVFHYVAADQLEFDLLASPIFADSQLRHILALQPQNRPPHHVLHLINCLEYAPLDVLARIGALHRCSRH